MNLRGAPDAELLTRLAGGNGEWILVTADGWTADEWKREVVHRWAHAIAGQDLSTPRRYSLRAHRP